MKNENLTGLKISNPKLNFYHNITHLGGKSEMPASQSLSEDQLTRNPAH